MNCITCHFGLYFKDKDVFKNCYSANLSNHYLKNSILYPCHPNCASCSDSGNDFDNNCLSCPTGFGLKPQTKNCVIGLQDKFYYDSVIKAYFPCYSSCLSCSTSGEKENHNCLTCDKGYFSLEEDKKFCFLETEQINFYIFKAQEKIFKNCQDNCKTCSQPKNYDGFNDYCIICKDGYFKSFDKVSNCYKEDRERYYLSFNKEQNEKIFYACFKSCLTCYGNGDASNHNCSKCDEANGFFIENENGRYSQIGFNCFNRSSSPYGSYLDINTNKFVRCADLNNIEKNKNLDILSFVPNFFDLYTPTDIQIKFNNYLSDLVDDYKISEVYLDATLSNGNPIRYQMDRKGFSCDTLYVRFNPPTKTSRFKIENIINRYRYLQSNNTLGSNPNLIDISKKSNIGSFQLNILKANNFLINVDPKKMNVLISENKIPPILRQDTNEFYTLFQSYIFLNNITQNLILRTENGNNIQIYRGSDESISSANKVSLENSFSYFDFRICLNKIIDYYNDLLKNVSPLKKEDIIIFKVDFQPRILSDASKYNGYWTKVYLYNDKSSIKEKIDLSICQDKIKMNIPANSLFPYKSPLDFTSAFYFKDKFKVDLYDYNGRLYTDVCFKYFENNTDYSVNDRRRDIFPNITISCSDNCKFEGLNIDTRYAICNCNSNSISDTRLTYLDKTLSDISASNLNLFMCFFTLFESNFKYQNMGYYFAIVIFFFYFCNIFLYTILPKIYRKIEEIDNPDLKDDEDDSIPEVNEIENQIDDENFNEYEESYENNGDIIPNINKAIDKEKIYYEISFSIFNDFIHKRIIDQKNVEKDYKKHLNTLSNLQKLILSDGCYFLSIDEKIKRKIVDNLIENKIFDKIKNSDYENENENKNEIYIKININGNNDKKINEENDKSNIFNFKVIKNEEKQNKGNIEVKFINNLNEEKVEIKNKNNKTLMSDKKEILGFSSINENNSFANKISLTENDKPETIENKNKRKENNNNNYNDNFNENKSDNKENDLFKSISVINIKDNSHGNDFNIHDHFKNNPYIINFKSDNIGKNNILYYI
jgi:hypothetical protein